MLWRVANKGRIMEFTNKEKKLELLAQIFEISMRINLETEMACFVSLSAHVSSIQIKVAKDKKDHFLDEITKHEFYYQCNWGDVEKEDAEFLVNANQAIKDLNAVFNRTFTKKYTAWCNLIDMSCSQVFTSEHAAKQWVKKMNRKYKKVHAIVGYKEELV